VSNATIDSYKIERDSSVQKLDKLEKEVKTKENLNKLKNINFEEN
jgi:hypothetical protein